MQVDPFETAYAESYPTVDQLSVFMANGVGQLARLTRVFSNTDVHILGLSVVNAVDCAIIRMVVDQPDAAYQCLQQAGFGINQAEILVVALPPGKQALLHTWVALLGAECNVSYTYPLLCRPHGQAALAVQSDNIEQACDVLRHKGFAVLDQDDLAGGE